MSETSAETVIAVVGQDWEQIVEAARKGEPGERIVVNMGPQHPSTHGVLRLRLALDGERVLSAEPIVGYMHRGAEKLFEVRDYRQIIMLANRHDWLSACTYHGRWREHGARSGPDVRARGRSDRRL